MEGVQAMETVQANKKPQMDSGVHVSKEGLLQDLTEEHMGDW